MSRRTVNRIERHNIDEITSYLPLPLSRPELWPAERLALMKPKVVDGVILGYIGSRRADLRWAEMQNQPYYGRMDIVLINDEPEICTCSTCGHMHERRVQYAVYPGPEGTLIGDVSKLTEVEREWALAESAECWKVPELRGVLSWPEVKTCK